MAGNRTICTTNNIDYLSIRKAMCAGARTAGEVAAATGLCTSCASCRSDLEPILKSVCGCAGVSLATVVEAIRGGADTVEKVGERTGAGTHCGRCKALIANIIELGY